LPKVPVSTITLIRPDDCHLHLRDGDVLRAVLPHSVRRFARAVVMPNLRPPIATTAHAMDYRRRILALVPPEHEFEPLMTLYLTEDTLPGEVERALASSHVVAIKYYPPGATTHSEAGVTRLDRIYPVLEAMEQLRMPLLIHGEVTDPSVDIFDRERTFLDRELVPLLERFPRLRVVLEHVTTREAVDFVANAGNDVAATITVHHLLMNRNAMLAGGIRPHHYCLPVLKREHHRQALVAAATSGNQKFFLGTDSAPHPRLAKESHCGCAGIFSAPVALELYAQVFEEAGALDRLEPFASRHGAGFYGLPVNCGAISLAKDPWDVPLSFPLGADEAIPLAGGSRIAWRILS
jgi:dihydroorotase